MSQGEINEQVAKSKLMLKSDQLAVLDQFVALAAKHPHCLAYPERLREVLEAEQFAVGEPWRRDLLLELCDSRFAPKLRLRKTTVAKQCARACESLMKTQVCSKEQAEWAVSAWREVAFPGSKALPLDEVDENISASAKSSARLPWAKCKVGDVFTFGNYPQTAAGEVQPIEWRVLRRDNDGLLVVSKYALDCRQYHESRCDITWSQCTLRQWLNGEFINKAFSKSERKRIKELHLSNPNSHWNNVPGGPATDDKIFLLSHDEAEQLFTNNGSRKCRATDYAKENNAYTVDDSMCCWWLRSPGNDAFYAAYVGSDGDVYYHVRSGDIAVRPAFKIAL